ncbi:sensor histidine kinase [Gaoshiqia sediminis]|uniref:histidine kinase n=1 Tax=Gaoshiqia sediminis TaxID=2986998 RepID=A0AA41Y7D4_9BACT|nr:ATP-binding protein [Gaoshiqia sediminis]MCW0483324.1 ATP-binding protein [Gaoshiqia sediminis]
MIRVSLKNRLSIGFGLLLLMVVLLWVTGAYFIYNLSNRSAAMLKENYQTVESTKFLIQSLDDLENQQSYNLLSSADSVDDSRYQSNLAVFRKNLEAVKNNITEAGEAEMIRALENHFNRYLAVYADLQNQEITGPGAFRELVAAYTATRNQIVALWTLNMDAISHKNSLLKNTAHGAFVIMSVIGTFCFIISALFFIQYPGYISKPIIQLTQGIKEIANRNYEQRLQFKSHDELGELAQAFNMMAAKLDEYEHSNLSQLLFEKKRIDTIINNMKDAIIGLDNSKHIIFSNAIACKILQMTPGELVGRHAPELAVRNELSRQILKEVCEENHPAKKEFHPIKVEQEGTPGYYTQEILDVVLTKTGEESPVNVGRVIILKNITHFFEQAEAKTNFIATISHELKTPIASLRLNLKLLDDPRIGELNEEQKNIIQALKEETRKMAGITSELLDLAQVETGNIPLNLQPVLPTEIIQYVKNPALNQAREKHISIDFLVDEPLPYLHCDSEKTAWVLLNLVNNAIQYSPENTQIQVEVKAVNQTVRFMVRDSGPGIEEQYLQQIFEKFFRVPGSGPKGTGLGLAISKEFITKQFGDIWVESEPGQGSRFYFSMPVYKTPF